MLVARCRVQHKEVRQHSSLGTMIPGSFYAPGKVAVSESADRHS